MTSTAEHRDAGRGDAALERCLAGQGIWGDDFDAAQIEAWFRDEAEGYAGLVAEGTQAYRYGYHALNALHGFDRLPAGWRSRHALGFGSAFGEELAPWLDRIERLTLLDASAAFQAPTLQGRAVERIPARPSGEIDAPEGSFDLITCLGVLHHVPNASFVLRELHRVASTGGWLLLREPITSLGDWRRPRSGLTLRERGFPRRALQAAIADAGWQVLSTRPCQFPPLTKAMSLCGGSVFDRRWLTIVDGLLCRAFEWNDHYHRTRLAERFGPGSLFHVLRKP
jgi:SAM-dependent methyltransferase